MGNSITSFLKGLFSQRDTRLVMVGLDGAGKTTILYKLKLGEVNCTIPTVGFNVETVVYNNTSFNVWDVGGQSKIRPLWKHYFAKAEGLIFVVDSTDHNRISEAREELTNLMRESELEMVSLLVFANKQDLPDAMTVAQMANALGLYSLQDRKWYIQATCARNGEGLCEGIDWLSRNCIKSNENRRYF